MWKAAECCCQREKEKLVEQPSETIFDGLGEKMKRSLLLIMVGDILD